MVENGQIIERQGVKLVFVVPETAPETVYCRAEIGRIDDGADEYACARAMLEGNCFWQGTKGGTLGLRGKVAYLTDRRDASFFEEEGVLEAYAEDMIDTVLLWRERIETYRLNGEVK